MKKDQVPANETARAATTRNIYPTCQMVQMQISALLLLIACAMIPPLGSCWTVSSSLMVRCVWSRKCHFGSTNSPVTLYTSLSTVLFVLKRKFKESKDLNRESWTSELGIGAGWEVRCLTKASSSLKTPAIPPFYKIITDNQSTKLVYNLVYRKDRGSRLECRGYWSRSSVRFEYLLGGRPQDAGGGSWIEDLNSGFKGVSGMQV